MERSYRGQQEITTCDLYVANILIAPTFRLINNFRFSWGTDNFFLLVGQMLMQPVQEGEKYADGQTWGDSVVERKFDGLVTSELLIMSARDLVDACTPGANIRIVHVDEFVYQVQL